MKALTVCQPFAELIIRGDKFVENRDWTTKHRGALAIHAGLSKRFLRAGDEEIYKGMVYGYIVGTCELQDVIHINTLRERARLSPLDRHILEHEYTSGPYCWVLGKVKRCRPVKAVGSMGLWEVRL